MSNEKSKDREQTVFKEENTAPQPSKSNGNQGKTSSGMDENVAGLFCYLGWFVTGIIFLLIEKENRFVRFHALQSIIVFGAVFVAYLVFMMIPILGLLLIILLWPCSIILWIVSMIKAYNGKWFKVPIVGNIVEKQLDQLKF